MKKGEIYVLHQPTKPLLTTVLVSKSDIENGFPMDEVTQNRLDELAKISDIVFMFPSENNKVNPLKFTSLYSGSAYVEYENNRASYYFIKVCNYFHELYDDNHNCFGAFNYVKFSNFSLPSPNSESLVTEDTVAKIYNCRLSDLSTPVLKITRLNSNDLYAIYSKPVKNKAVSFIDKVKSLLNINKEKSENIEEMYSTHETDSSMIYIPFDTIKIILEFYNSEESDFKSIVDSFTYNDCDRFIPSVIKYLNIKYLDHDINTIQLEYDFRTEGL